jgi:hypothetical protein
MKNNKILLVILAIALVLGMTACGNGSTGGGNNNKTAQTDTYTGTANDGSTYTLEITQKSARFAVQVGDTYKLTKDTKTSKGVVEKVEGENLTLKPDEKTAETFYVAVSSTGGKIDAISGTITFNDNTTVKPEIKGSTIMANSVTVNTFNGVDLAPDVDFNFGYLFGNDRLQPIAKYIPGTIIMVKNKKLTMTLGTPNANILEQWDGMLFPANQDDVIINGFSISDPQAKVVFMGLFCTKNSGHGMWCIDGKRTNRNGEFVYLDKDITVNGSYSWKEKDENDPGIEWTYTFSNCLLKEGWNYLSSDGLLNDINKTVTITWKSYKSIPSDSYADIWW